MKMIQIQGDAWVAAHVVGVRRETTKVILVLNSQADFEYELKDEAEAAKLRDAIVEKLEQA